MTCLDKRNGNSYAIKTKQWMLTGLFYFHRVASFIRLKVLSLCRCARREGEEKQSKKGGKVSIKALKSIPESQ